MDNKDIKILVVDDEEIIRRLFTDALKGWGYQVDMASDGKEAIECCARSDYHIVLTDLNMPNLDGISLINRIKSRWPLMEIIVITGYGTIETAIDAMKLGAIDFILKPVNFDHVRFIIKKCAQKIKANNENQELREMNTQLRELNEMKDKFLSITNHEIRTPLTIIRGYLEILDTVAMEIDEESQEILDIIKRTTLELSETVDRMHTLSKIDHLKWTEIGSAVDICKLVKEIYSEMERLFHHRAIEFYAEHPDKPLLVRGTKDGLRLLLRELLQNALKFTPDNGKVTVKVISDLREVIIEVKDTGIGIAYEKQDLIFTDFYEVQDSINHKSSQAEFMGGGMGIGLTLVKDIVITLRGRIIVDSEPNVGSTFKIYLPKLAKKAEAPVDAVIHS